MKPVLSILALCYNHEAFLPDALESLENVSGVDSIEILIADDASTDGSPQILNLWKEKHPEWRFFLSAQNKGNCQTFNQLLNEAKGDWILDFATDDILDPDRISAWLKVAEQNPEAGIVYADAWIFGKKPEKRLRFSEQLRPEERWKSGFVLGDLFRRPFICPPAVLFRREALLEVGGYNPDLAFEDWDSWLRLARRFPVVPHPEPVIFYRQHPDSLSASLWNKRNARLLQSTVQILEMVLGWPERMQFQADFLHFVRYHIRLCFYLQLPELAGKFGAILKKAGGLRIQDRLLIPLSGWMPFVFPLYRFYRKQRHWRI